MCEMCVVLLAIWIIVNLLAEYAVISASCSGSGYFYFDAGRYTNPAVVYKEAIVNWFGAIILALLYTAALPLLAIQYWIYWLFTVGR